MPQAPPERDTLDTLVTVDRVRVAFGKLIAVHDLSFELKAGDLVGLIGPNGAGKTTLLRAIAGLQPLTAGQVHILGHRVTPGDIRALAHVGFTPDNPPVYEEHTVRRFLQFVARGHRIDPAAIDETIDFWLERVWLTAKADQKIRALSRGMRQRIGIARTLLPKPPVILLDEPAAGLDPAGRVQFRRFLCSLRDQGKTLIVSSHILADLSEYCTHIGIMAHGALVQYGTVNEVVAAGDGRRCRYTIVLTDPTPIIRDVLDRFAGIAAVEIDRERVTCEYDNAPADAARLLAHLVAERIPVASFTPNTPDLEEAYLRTGIRQVD